MAAIVPKLPAIELPVSGLAILLLAGDEGLGGQRRTVVEDVIPERSLITNVSRIRPVERLGGRP